MTKASNQKAIKTGSGIDWDDWLEFLDKSKARGLNHTELAKLAHQKIIENAKSKSPEWWAQSVAVAYEQHIGKRQPGQTCDGNFSVTVSKTVAGNMDDVLQKWVDAVQNADEFNSVKILLPAKISKTDKWRYWRCKLEDDSMISVNIQTKTDGHKSMLAINHDKLDAASAVEQWRNFWKEFKIQ